VSISAYYALRHTAAWIDLSARGKLLVSGEDAARLLHAISTNHVNDLAPGAGLYAFFLNDKGRILADARIFRLESGYFLDTEPETAVFLRDHIDRYIIADDAYVTDESADWAVIGLEGPDSHLRAAELNLPVPEKDLAILPWEDGFVAKLAFAATQGLRIWVRSAKKQALVDRLTALQTPEVAAKDARLVRIENGIPRYGEDITDRYLVQETQALHAVHFTKGCYLGQEIVERVRSRGQVHRFLTSIRLETANTPERGAKLLANGAAAGEITSAAYSPALSKVVAMAYLRADVLQSKAGITLAESLPAVVATVA
jgi:folate-binding protein YgfZ